MPKIAFTAARLQGFTCPPDRAQAFLWDATVRGLGLRVTAAKGAAYVFQSIVTVPPTHLADRRSA